MCDMCLYVCLCVCVFVCVYVCFHVCVRTYTTQQYACFCRIPFITCICYCGPWNAAAMSTYEIYNDEHVSDTMAIVMQ